LKQCAAILSLLLPTAALSQSVVTYHNSPARSGAYKVEGLTLAAAATIQPDKNFKASLNGDVYAQPLYWHRKDGPAELIVATESNTVYALNPDTGAILWQQALPAPAPLNQLGCGDIDPEGITGTPVIDPATGTLYLDALTYTGGNVRHELYALSLATGAPLAGWPLDVQAALAKAGATFSSQYQGERSALLLYRSNIYAVYGGRYGDCLPYHGTIVQVDPATQSLVASWQTRASGGGIWAQGGIASEGTALYVTTGNTQGADDYGDGESVVRLKPGLARSNSNQDFYAPSNWHALDQGDLDLGGTEALPVNVSSGNGRTAARVIAFGKDGNAYLLDRANLGGVGGRADIVAVAQETGPGGGIRTGPAVYSTATEDRVAITNPKPIGCSATGIMMIRLVRRGNTPVSVDWCAAYSGDGSPIVTTTDGTANPIVWVTGNEGDNELHGFNALTGATVFDGAATTMSGLHKFSTLIAADGRLYVGADNTVYAFRFKK
jgi:outer membrane protein assembly factor BamB